ncbi:hypothetical protein GGI07_000201 [Coemansia sp. Benny D115]|nr:hypothetical protein GGI07_000201 [Coemansia sp. Benny D115]
MPPPTGHAQQLSTQRGPNDDAQHNPPAQPEKKKKRLTQACQHCRKKKIRCDGLRPSCKNCIKNKAQCHYSASVRKRGRNGQRMPMMSTFVAAGPYDRPMQMQPTALSSMTGHMPMVGASSAASSSAIRHHQSQFYANQPSQQQLSLQMSSLGHQQIPQHQLMPPPSMPRPQINPLGASSMTGGPISTHLKRDPGFGNDVLEDGMFDQAKQAQELSTHFILPINSMNYSAFTPSFASNNDPQQGSSSQAARGNSTNGSLDGMGLNGANPNHFGRRSASGSNTSYYRYPDSGFGSGPSSSKTSGSQANAAPGPGSSIPSNFDPTILAQNLSSAYVSVIASMPAGSSAQGDAVPGGSSGVPSQPKSATALGKSASHTPLGMFSDEKDMDANSPRMRQLRKKIHAIIASIWEDTECGRSAGMAGITAGDDDMCIEDGYGSSVNGNSPSLSQSGNHAGAQSATAPAAAGGPGAVSKTLVSPSGDRSMDDHLINTFFDYVHHQLPIIQRSEFTKAYQQGQVSSLLICAMCSASSVFLNRIEDERKSIYNLYSQKVREQFHDACFNPSLEVVQTALIMTLCEYRNGSLPRAWVYLSMGFRLAISMGYHHHDSKIRDGPMQSSPEIAYRETCRRAFWGAFLLDRYTAIGGGKALGINDHDISVLLPLRDEDWQASDVAPPLASLEFFKPISTLSSKQSTASLAEDANSVASGLGKELDVGSSIGMSAMQGSSSSSCGSSNTGSPLARNALLSRHGSASLSSSCIWDRRAGEASPLGYFIKLMSVVGQVAQHINTTKTHSGGKGASAKVERPSKGYAALDDALLRWKEELPTSLSYSEAKSMEIEPEAAVFISCMHAIYYGAVIMLNRENMGFLRDLPGQLDVSTNLAIRSLERCRVAAMEVVEISHHICSLPASMTNALLPWALFQAGTLLIHFMIAGSTPQAQEEARSAILSLDCALKDQLSRYWNVSTKYHLILSNMVKAWERTRQATPSVTPGVSGMHAQTQPMSQSASGCFGDASTADPFNAFSAHMNLPMQMQMHMQLPEALQDASGRQGQPGLQQQTSRSEPFSTLLKPYSVPVTATGDSMNVKDGVSGMVKIPNSSQNPSSQPQRGIASHPLSAIDTTVANQNIGSNFMFTADTAQDSINTLNAFLSQLTQEQARQFNEGLQSFYTLQGGLRLGGNAINNNGPFGGPGAAMVPSNMAASTGVGSDLSARVGNRDLGNNAILSAGIQQQLQQQQQQQQSFMLSNPALQRLRASGFDSVGQDRLQLRRGSLPISSSGDLFTAPGASLLSASTASISSSGSNPGPSMAFLQQPSAGDHMLSSELDPLLFNPMTPFLQELQLYNVATLQQQSHQHQQQQQTTLPSGSGNPSSNSMNDKNSRAHN